MSLFCGVCRKKVDIKTEHVVRLVITLDSHCKQLNMVLEYWGAFRHPKLSIIHVEILKIVFGETVAISSRYVSNYNMWFPLLNREYFRKACDVEAPEIHFNIDQYTDATLVVKPQIYISVDDLLNTHSKLLEYQAKIAPQSTDIIHELLDDLGEKAPTIEELLGGLLVF